MNDVLNQNLIHTTIGDLVEAITEIALESGKSEEEGYQLASLTIESILRRNRVAGTAEQALH